MILGYKMTNHAKQKFLSEPRQRYRNSTLNRPEHSWKRNWLWTLIAIIVLLSGVNKSTLCLQGHQWRALYPGEREGHHPTAVPHLLSIMLRKLYYDFLAPGADTRDKMAPAPEMQKAPRRIRGRYLRKRLKSLHKKGYEENDSSSSKLGPRAAGALVYSRPDYFGIFLECHLLV